MQLWLVSVFPQHIFELPHLTAWHPVKQHEVYFYTTQWSVHLHYSVTACSVHLHYTVQYTSTLPSVTACSVHLHYTVQWTSTLQCHSMQCTSTLHSAVYIYTTKCHSMKCSDRRDVVVAWRMVAVIPFIFASLKDAAISSHYLVRIYAASVWAFDKFLIAFPAESLGTSKLWLQTFLRLKGYHRTNSSCFPPSLQLSGRMCEGSCFLSFFTALSIIWQREHRQCWNWTGDKVDLSSVFVCKW
jgi:hypothetical protein